MMAGLLQSENDMVQQRVPGLGKLPILGPLFSSRAYQRRETDLMLLEPLQQGLRDPEPIARHLRDSMSTTKR